MTKPYLFFLLAFGALFLAACDSRSVRKELQRVDSLNQCGASLDSIRTMPALVGYYDVWGSANDRMAAHYLLGCVARDQKNLPLALRNYYDAVNCADTLSDCCDFRRLSRVYGQIAELYHRQRAPQLEIEAERKAVDYAWRCKDTLAALIYTKYLGSPFHMLHQMDSALYYNELARTQLKAYGYPDLAAGILPMSIDIYLRRGDYQRAGAAIADFERNSNAFNDEGEILRGYELYYSYKGHYFMGINRLDSAEYYYRKLLSAAADFDKAGAACHGLLNLYEQYGIADSVAKYARLYCQANDSAAFKHASDEMIRTQSLYNYEEHERIARQKTEETRRYKAGVIGVTVVLALFVLGGYRFYRHLQWKRKKELMDANAEYSSLLMQYDRNLEDLRLSKQDAVIFRQEKERTIHELQQRLAVFQDGSQMAEQWDIEQAMLHSDIVINLHRLASRVHQPSAVEWNTFREFVKKELPEYFRQMTDSEYALTPQEQSVGMLIRLQFSPGELAALLDVSKQRINNVKRQINQKMFHEKGATTLTDNLLSLVST